MVNKTGKQKKDSVYIDIEKVGNLFVRLKMKGDKILIAKDKSQKLKNLFINEKIPKRKRELYPIVVTEEDEAVWVPYLRLSEKFKAGVKSKKIINIKIKNNER